LRVAHQWRMFDSEVAHPAANKSAGSTASSAHQSRMDAVPSHSVAAFDLCVFTSTKPIISHSG
jgi:hypothetical protein